VGRGAHGVERAVADRGHGLHAEEEVDEKARVRDAADAAGGVVGEREREVGDDEHRERAEHVEPPGRAEHGVVEVAERRRARAHELDLARIQRSATEEGHERILARMRAVVTALFLAAAPALPADGSVTVGGKVVALNHVRVIDGTGAAARPDQMIVVEGGKIRSVGPAGKPPPGAKVLELAGASVIPGLVGMHDHLFMTVMFLGVPFWNEAVSSAPRLYLASGVTTIRTAGSMEPYTDLNLKRMIDEGKLPGPK